MKAAQAWSESQLAAAKMEHDSTIQGTAGENLFYAMSTSVDYTKTFDTAATQAWYDEIKDYDFAKPAFGPTTGHFTQVVWKASTKIGCGHAADATSNVYVTCRYSPAGNMQDAFADNVLALTDASAGGAGAAPAKAELQSGSGSSPAR